MLLQKLKKIKSMEGEREGSSEGKDGSVAMLLTLHCATYEHCFI